MTVRQSDSQAGRQLHQGQPVYTAGAALKSAQAAMILLHGRGASARDILQLGAYFPYPNMVYLAPQAAGFSWWPYRFMDPLERNQPWLSSALQVVDDLAQGVEAVGLPMDRLVLAGFSQGACLACEYAYRSPRRYGGVFIFSGGLVGPSETLFPVSGSLQGTPVFIGCGDVDPHIPLARVDETAVVFARMQAQVTKVIYPRMGHTISDAELEQARQVGGDLFKKAD